MKAGKSYLKIVEWSEEDGCYVGTCPGLMLGGIHGKDEAKVYRELCEAVEEWVAIQKADGEPLPDPTAGKTYSGKFVLRAGAELHKQLALAALREGESLNTFCLNALTDRAGAAIARTTRVPQADPSAKPVRYKMKRSRT